MNHPKLPASHSVRVNLSDTVYRALQKRASETGDSINHLIQRALVDEFDIEHHTLYQVSTSTALVQGVYQGCVTVGQIKQHGNFGLGTYDALDGEGLMLDGRVWHAMSNGQVVEAPDGETAPFWVCTEFEADQEATLATVSSWDDLTTQLDKLHSSQNLFVAYRVDGEFDEINYRVACKSEPGTNLVAATSHQAEFTFQKCTGTLMGFWTPTYARTFNIPGYHLHFLSEDHQHGGHVLNVKAQNLKVQVMTVQNVTMALPESPQFLAADLSGDPSAALSKAEGARD